MIVVDIYAPSLGGVLRNSRSWLVICNFSSYSKLICNYENKFILDYDKIKCVYVALVL